MDMKHLDELKSLHLPAGDFAVFGSGPLAIRGWRDSQDIDIIVRRSLWNELSEKYKDKIKAEKEIQIGNVSIFRDWLPWFADNDALIDSADEFAGIRFVSLENVLKWKQAMGREKDLKDIELININLTNEKTANQ